MGKVKDHFFTDTENEFKKENRTYTPVRYVFLTKEFLGIEHNLHIEYTYYPASKGIRGSCGEPLEPDEEETIEMGKVSILLNGTYYEIETDDDNLEDEVWEIIKEK